VIASNGVNLIVDRETFFTASAWRFGDFLKLVAFDASARRRIQTTIKQRAGRGRSRHDRSLNEIACGLSKRLICNLV
jgi:hypothetical protein